MLSQADLTLVAVVVVMMTAWIAVQGIALWIVAGRLIPHVGVVTAVLVYASISFVNNTTPFGEVGGGPVGAKLLGDATDTDYETALAAVLSINPIDFVTSISLALTGIAVYTTQTTLSDDLTVALGVLAVFGSGLVLAALVVWLFRPTVERLLVGVLTPPLRLLGRVIPRQSPPSPNRIETGFERFFESIEQLATDRRRVAAALVFSAGGSDSKPELCG